MILVNSFEVLSSACMLFYFLHSHTEVVSLVRCVYCLGYDASDLASILCGLHLLDGNLALADAVSCAHLLHGADVLLLEVDEALVEAIDLGFDHKLGHRILVVGRR